MLRLATLALLIAPKASGSAWVRPAGTARLGWTASALDTRQQLASGEARGLVGPLCPEPIQPGDRMPYSCATGGRFRLIRSTLDAAIGLHPALSLDLALPLVLHTSFSDDFGTTSTGGLGDVRGGLRLGDSGRVGAAALALHVKAPTGPTGFEDRDVPVGDGQWDVELGARLGRGLGPGRWVELHQGWRWRLPIAATQVDPGDEYIGQVGGGLSPGDGSGPVQLGLQLQLQWLLARADVDAFGLPHPGRRQLSLRLGPIARLGERGWAEAGLAAPLWGQRWPAAPSAWLGLGWQVGQPSR